MRPSAVGPSLTGEARSALSRQGWCLHRGDEADVTPALRHPDGATGGTVDNCSSMDPGEDTTDYRTDVRYPGRRVERDRVERCSVRRRAAAITAARRPALQRSARIQERGAGRPTPCQRSRGTFWTAQSASQTSRAGTPASSAASAVRLPSATTTVSRTSTRPKGPNSSATARWNSLTFTQGDSAHREVGVELRDQLVGQRVGHRGDALDDRQAIAHFAHDHRDRRVERIRHRGEDLGAGFLLAALHLAQVAERDTRTARDLAQRHRLLKAEVAEDIAEFLSYENHGVPPCHKQRVRVGWLRLPAALQKL